MNVSHIYKAILIYAQINAELKSYKQAITYRFITYLKTVNRIYVKKDNCISNFASTYIRAWDHNYIKKCRLN